MKVKCVKVQIESMDKSIDRSIDEGPGEVVLY